MNGSEWEGVVGKEEEKNMGKMSPIIWVMGNRNKEDGKKG
jgi:hypothetical protein